jgi:hypothetical protein
LRSLVDTVVRLLCRANVLPVVVKLPFSIAVFTASVNDENDATVCIGFFDICS